MKTVKFPYSNIQRLSRFVLKTHGHCHSPNLGICCKTFFSESVNVSMFHMEMDGKRQLKLCENYSDPTYSLEEQRQL